MGKATCSIDGCTRDSRTRGLCSAHYQRLLAGRDMAAPLRNPTVATCAVEACDRETHGRDLCDTHAARLRRGADLAPPIRKLSPKGSFVPCSYDGCDRKSKARGMCQRHHSQWLITENPDRPACSVEVCSHPVKSSGLCGGHYRRMLLGKPLDTPLAARAKRGWSNPCTVYGCSQFARARGLCYKHYSRWRTHGDPLATPGRPRGRMHLCEVVNCCEAHHADGLCETHGAMPASELAELSRHERRRLETSGYVYVRPPVGYPDRNRRDSLAEHRLVLEGVIGRPLLPTESPHHRNGVRSDNRPENLELWVKSQPAGQRAEDLVIWAREILDRYGYLYPEVPAA